VLGEGASERGSERTCVRPFKVCVTWMCGTGLVQIGVYKSGGAKLYTRVSEMLQWILSSKGLGKHPAQMLKLHITDLGLPHKASVTIYAGHRLVCVRCGGGEGGGGAGAGGDRGKRSRGDDDDGNDDDDDDDDDDDI